MRFKKNPALRTGSIAAISVLLSFSSRRVAGDDMYRLPGHVPSAQIHSAEYLGSSDAGEVMHLALVLQPRDSSGLEEFLRRLQDPRDPLFRRYLTTAEFADRFGASSEDIIQVTGHLARFGLRVSQVHENRLVIDVEGPASAVEDAFQVQMGKYLTRDGRTVFAANADPIFPAELASKIQIVAGLNGFTQRKPHLAGERNIPADGVASVWDFMTPPKIKSAYEMTSLTQTGAGETLALFELDGYTGSDISTYSAFFSLPTPNLENVLVDHVSGAPGGNSLEVTLDIELAAAVAPGLAKIMVYEGLSSDQGIINIYSKIASDNIATVVSTSWGAPEDANSPSLLNAEKTIFQQMAAQGQSIFAASGDSGAYDDISNRPKTLLVDDPASQPYVTGVGGTTVTVNTANTFQSETAWGDTARSRGGGGGVSQNWPIPSWQVPVGSNANGANPSQRMVPDVSLNANPDTGYPVYFTPPGGPSKWALTGGTSCAAPIWAAYMALVNQKLVANGKARIGFANPALYQVAESAQYPEAFHDVNDGSSNLFYESSIDYDLATGWGSLNGAGLFTNLTGTLPAALDAPSVPTDFAAKAGN